MFCLVAFFVALRKESVDRNESNAPTPTSNDVALRKESVDRNNVAKCKKTIKQVALRKESVDRNDRVASGEPATFVGRSP